MSQPHVCALDHLVLTVASNPTTIAFYERALGMQATAFETATAQRRWALAFGRSKINLHEAGREFEPKARRPTAGSADLCFLTDVARVNWINHLDAEQISIEEGPVDRTGAQGPLQSIYIRDPDQNLIEIAVQS